VCAICSADKDTVRLFGCGVYEGLLPVPDGTPGAFGTPEEIIERARNILPGVADDVLRERLKPILTNPRILLDNGAHVWGWQCWWGPEEKIKEAIGGRKVEIVAVPGESKVEPKAESPTVPPPGEHKAVEHGWEG
jgi:hypothetical protein